MEISDYKERLKKMKERHAVEESKLAREYAFSNNTVNVGDIVEDHMGFVLVESIGYSKGSLSYRDTPQCVYHGSNLTKASKLPRKNGERVRAVFQTNIKSIEKKNE